MFEELEAGRRSGGARELSLFREPTHRQQGDVSPEEMRVWIREFFGADEPATSPPLAPRAPRFEKGKKST